MVAFRFHERTLMRTASHGLVLHSPRFLISFITSIACGPARSLEILDGLASTFSLCFLAPLFVASMLRAQYRVSRQKYADPITESTREGVKTNPRDASLSMILPNESSECIGWTDYCFWKRWLWFNTTSLVFIGFF